MKIGTDPDIFRRHQKTPRSYREATGKFAQFERRRWRNRLEQYGLNALTIILMGVVCLMIADGFIP